MEGGGASKNPNPAENLLPEFIQVLLIDNHKIMRSAIKETLLIANGSLKIQYYDHNAGCLDILDSLCPDIILISITLNDKRSVILIKEILRRNPLQLIIALTTTNSPAEEKNLISCGVKACLDKFSACEKYLQAITFVMNKNA